MSTPNEQGESVTATTTTDPECPTCHAFDSVDLSDGVHLCLQCRTEWRPGDVTILPPPAPQRVVTTPNGPVDIGDILSATSIEEVLAAVLTEDDEADVITLHVGDVAAAPDDWAGKFARHGDGTLLLIIDDDGRETMVAQRADGSTLDVWRSQLVYIGDVDADTDPVPPAFTDDEPLPQTILAVAGLTLTVALAAIVSDGADGETVAAPRIGWLPPPCDQVPEAECGVAYAAALLIHVFGLDKEQVSRLAANLITGAEAGTETESQ